MTNFISKIVLFLFVLGTIYNVKGQVNYNKGSLFIIGGGSRPVELIKKIIRESEIDKDGYGIVLPMASSEQDSSVFYAKIPFHREGVKNIYGMYFKEKEIPTNEQLDSIKNAKLIYISGGDQDRFMKIVINTPIEMAIRENFKRGGMIAGTSAGAAVMSEKMITGNELKHGTYHSTFLYLEENNIELKKGLGFIKNAIIDQHFVRRSRYNRLITAVIEYPTLKGVGIDESTAIFIKDGRAEVVGNSQVIVLSNMKRSKDIRNGKLAAQGIKMDIYLNGDTFKFKL